MFLQPEHNVSQVVVSRECLHSQILSRTSPSIQRLTIKRAASILRESVLNHVEEAVPLPWPQTVESLALRDKQYPEHLDLFFKKLLSDKDTHHSERVDRLTDSFCQDIVYAVSKGQFLAPKHASLGHGLHSLTGQKCSITMLAKLGQSITYDTVNQIETAQAELVEHFQSMSLNLSLQPVAQGYKVSFSLVLPFCILFICKTIESERKTIVIKPFIFFRYPLYSGGITSIAISRLRRVLVLFTTRLA